MDRQNEHRAENDINGRRERLNRNRENRDRLFRVENIHAADWQNFRCEQRRWQIEVRRAFLFEDNADRHRGGAENPVRERDLERDLEWGIERDLVRDNDGNIGRNFQRDNGRDIERDNQQQLQNSHRPNHPNQPNRIDIEGDRLIFEHWGLELYDKYFRPVRFLPSLFERRDSFFIRKVQDYVLGDVYSLDYSYMPREELRRKENPQRRFAIGLEDASLIQIAT